MIKVKNVLNLLIKRPLKLLNRTKNTIQNPEVTLTKEGQNGQMIDVYEAIELFRAYTHEFVGGILDVGHSFVISSVGENGEEIYDSPIAVNKITREITTYFPPDHWDELDNAIEIDFEKIKEIVESQKDWEEKTSESLKPVKIT